MKQQRAPARAPVRRTASPAGRGRDDLKQEIAGVLLAALGIWLYLGLLGSGGGKVGGGMADGLRLLCGQGAWVVPGLLIVLGGYLVYLRQGFVLSLPMWGTGLLVLDLLAALQAVAFPREQAYLSPAGGGLVGFGILTAVNPVFGQTGRWVLFVALALVGAVLSTNLSLSKLLQGLLRLGKTIGVRVWAFFYGVFGGGRPRPRQPRVAAAEPEPRPAKPVRPVILEFGDNREEPAGKPQLTGLRGGKGARAARADDTEPAAQQAAAALSRPAGADEPPFDFQPTPELAPVITLHNEEPSRSVQVKLPVDMAEHGLPLEQAPAEKERTKVLKLRKDSKEPVPSDLVDKPQDKGSLTTPGADLGFELPPVSLLANPQRNVIADSKEDITERIRLLEHTLKTFGAEAKVMAVTQGPTITRFEVQPLPGVKVAKIANLKNDLSLSLAGDVRIDLVASRQAVGIEVPNREIASVFMRDVLDTNEFRGSPSKLTVALGKAIDGKPVLGVLEKMPHLLIAGTTGSGKSVCMNAIICSLLYKARPDEVKILMIDPKKVELAVYDGIPHLAAPVVTEPRRAAGFLKWAVKEMENRYDLFAASGCRNVAQYNQMVQDDPYDGGSREEPRTPLPYVVIFIDELADLMMVAGTEVEDAICRLAQMARAAGMHLVIATQRPSVDVITGVIKNNIPSRIAFSVSSQTDSRVILDMGGAEALLGRGDMLVHFQGMARPMRAQCAFISEQEVEAITNFVKKQGGHPEYSAEALELETPVKGRGHGGAEDGEAGSGDQSFAKAVWICIEEGQASVSLLQRRMRVNYTKAVRLVDDMEERGYVGKRQGVKPRDVLLGRERYLEIFGEIPS